MLHMLKHIVFLGLILMGCQAADPEPDEVKIVCTTGMIGDALANVVDTTVQVVSLMGPGTDPHLFKPTKSSLDHLSSADIIVANGLHLEGRMQDILEKIGRTKPVIFLGEGIEERHLLYGDDAEQIPDPHLWFDLKLWVKGLDYVVESLQKESISTPGYDDYKNELVNLDRWVDEEISSVSEESRVLLTAHDAFAYFGQAYGIEVIGLQGISTVAEYGIRDVTNMVDLIEARGIKAVFVESSISSRSIEAVVAGAQKRNIDVSIGGTLYSDALGPRGSGAETYIGMVQHNVKTIVNALR